MSRFIGFKMMAVCCVFVLSLVFVGFSHADTFTVMNLDDSGEGSLRQAIIDANENENGPGVVDDIVFADGLTGTIEFDVIIDFDVSIEAGANAAEPASGEEMKITDDVNIIGPGKDVLTIDAKNQDRIFSIAKPILMLEGNAVEERIKVSISGLKFINGAEKVGGAIFNSGELSVDSCEFSNNEASGGGAIFNAGQGIITEIKDSDFIMNKANTGGAIVLEGVFEDITIRAVDEEITKEPTLGKISGSTFDQNTADQIGGAIAVISAATIKEISSTSFSNNAALNRFGGAIYIENLPRSVEQESLNSQQGIEMGYNLESLTDCEFTNNTAPAGGAILNNFGSIGLIADCSFVGNTAVVPDLPPDPKLLLAEPEPNESVAGGAIANAGGLIVEIARTTFSLNTSQGFGGAIVNAAIVDDSGGGKELIETAAPGMIEFERAQIMNMHDSTFDENSASISGGALANASGTIEMVNITYSENIAGETGGAIYNRDVILNPIETDDEGEVDSKELATEALETAPITFASFTTFARNEAGMEGGAIYEEIVEDEEPKSIHLRHSILALNVGGNCGGFDAKDEGGNHSDDETCPLTAGNMATIVLGELADNGGPTKTIALLDGDAVDSAVECTAITIFGVIAEAIDPVLPVEVDQRGAPRAFGENCDAGAFEFGAIVPGGFFHNPLNPGIAGNPNMLTAEEATPEGSVAFVWGFMPGSVIIGGATCNGTEIAIKQPRLLGIVGSDTEGIAEMMVFVPLIGDLEFPVLTQAVDISTCATSEVIEDVIRKE